MAKAISSQIEMTKETKKCTTCGAVKPREDFYAHGKYLQARCKECVKDRVAARERKLLATSTPYRRAYNKRKSAERKRRYALNPAYKATVLAKNKKREQTTKDRVFEAYGGYCCACCGETGKSFLSIDHVDNNGAEHRRIVGLGGAPTYRWLVYRGFPEGFQVLCHNCNWSKHVNHGTCEHVISRGSSTIPYGSTPEAIAGGSAPDPIISGHDIVSSASKDAAVKDTVH